MEDKKILRRSQDDRMLGGVCGGLGEYFDLDPVLFRILFALLALGGVGSGAVAYFLLWLIVPEAEAASAG